MTELVHERAISLRDAEGNLYDRARVYAEPQRGGTWGGWIEFLTPDGKVTLRTRRETTQSNVEGVAYWATGLEALYLDGALGRAQRLKAGVEEPGAEGEPVGGDAGEAAGHGVVRMRLETVDPVAPLHLMATRTLVPGQRRWIKDGGVIVYERTVRAPSQGSAGVYEFAAQFGSDNAAALMANRLWSDLHGLGARLFIGGVEVTMTNAAIKEALLGATVS